jgi:hypothetical protein
MHVIVERVETHPAKYRGSNLSQGTRYRDFFFVSLLVSNKCHPAWRHDRLLPLPFKFIIYLSTNCFKFIFCENTDRFVIEGATK